MGDAHGKLCAAGDVTLSLILVAGERERERVQLAILKLSQGSEEKCASTSP